MDPVAHRGIISTMMRRTHVFLRYARRVFSVTAYPATLMKICLKMVDSETGVVLGFEPRGHGKTPRTPICSLSTTFVRSARRYSPHASGGSPVVVSSASRSKHKRHPPSLQRTRAYVQMASLQGYVDRELQMPDVALRVLTLPRFARSCTARAPRWQGDRGGSLSLRIVCDLRSIPPHPLVHREYSQGSTKNLTSSSRSPRSAFTAWKKASRKSHSDSTSSRVT